MFSHRPFRSPTAGAALLRSSCPVLHHRRHRCCPGVARLEDRTLLSAADGFGHDRAHATDINLTGSESVTLTGTLGATDTGAGPSADFFRISPTEAGRLFATVHPQGVATRLSLLDDQGRLVIQSDGLSRDNPDDLIDLHIPAGTNYLVVEGQGGAGSYILTTGFTSSAPPFLPLNITDTVFPSLLHTIGDFNGDGVSDIAGPDGIHLAVGDGTFRNPSSGFGIPRDSFFPEGDDAMTSGDFNGDGRLDLAVSEQRFATIPPSNSSGYWSTVVLRGTGDIAVLLGNGDGTFRTPVRSKAVADLTDPEDHRSLVTGDFNGDGRLDLAAANPDSGDIAVLLGKGDGTFQTPVQYKAGDSPNSLVMGDFNGDGRADLAAANGFSDDIAVLLGNGDGTFQAPVRVEAGAPFTDFTDHLVTGDFNGDGRADLAAIISDLSILPSPWSLGSDD